MKMTRNEIIDLLQEQGDMGTAQQARANLPAEVDTDRDAEMLKTTGIDIENLLQTT